MLTAVCGFSFSLIPASSLPCQNLLRPFTVAGFGFKRRSEKAENLHYYCSVKNMVQKTHVKKKLRSKGERLNWGSLKTEKPLLLTDELLQGQKITKKHNNPVDPNLLVP